MRTNLNQANGQDAGKTVVHQAYQQKPEDMDLE